MRCSAVELPGLGGRFMGATTGAEGLAAAASASTRLELRIT